MIEVRPVTGLPEIGPGDRLGEMIAERGRPLDGDVVVVSQKAVSKAEGLIRTLSEVRPSPRARELATRLDRDPRFVELVLADTRRVVRATSRALIVETRSGLICANAGIDASNVPGNDSVVLLPRDPDASARKLRAAISAASQSSPAVIIADSFGRPWRLGQTDIAIGCAGIVPFDDWRGRADRDGAELEATVIATADEAAAAASLARDKASGEPAAIITGLARHVGLDAGPGAAALRRSPAEDLFR